MAYSLQGLVCDLSTAKRKQLPSLVVVALAQNKALIPFTYAARKAYQIPSLPLIVGKDVPVELSELVSVFNEPQLAYVEAEFFGGVGDQAAIVRNNGKIILGPLIEAKAINKALCAIGVKLGDFNDEFEALDLGNHRYEECWLNPEP